MNILITGANGFLGQYLVGEALRQGHRVRAMVRPAVDERSFPWAGHPQVSIVRADLRSPAGLADVVRGVDTVIHAAAAKSGDFYSRFAGTVIATEHLLAAMKQAGVRRIVLVSSFALYDYMNRWSWATLDEGSPLEPRPETRHAYCRTKLIQERLVRRVAEQEKWDCVVIRPGAIFGRDTTWTTRLGVAGRRWWVRMGAWAPVPLTYVENCAEAIVMAAAMPEAVGKVFNVVDDETPTQRRYMAELRRRTKPRPRVIPINWTLLRVTARCGSWVNRGFFRGRAKVPSILVPASLHASAKPLRYSNRLIKQTLGWKPRYTLREALDRCYGPVPHPPSAAAASVSNVTPEPAATK